MTIHDDEDDDYGYNERKISLFSIAAWELGKARQGKAYGVFDVRTAQHCTAW